MIGQKKEESSNESGYFEGAARMAVGMMPYAGGILDMYEGARDGNWVQFGIGIGSLALDVAMPGSGTLIKGGVKAIGTQLVEAGVKKSLKEIGEAEVKNGIRAAAKQADVNVVRGGTCKACQFTNGSGVTVDSKGLLDNVSVNSVQGKTVKELSEGIPNGSVGTTTVKQIEAVGGKVTPDPTRNNPNHARLSGITAEQAEKLFNPVIKNPTK